MKINFDLDGRILRTFLDLLRSQCLVTDSNFSEVTSMDFLWKSPPDQLQVFHGITLSTPWGALRLRTLIAWLCLCLKNVKLLHFLTMSKSHRMGLLKHDGCGACSLCLVDNCDMCNMSDYAPMKWTQRAFIFLTTVYLMPGGGGKNTRPRWWGCGHILSNTRQRVPKLFVLATVHFLGE